MRYVSMYMNGVGLKYIVCYLFSFLLRRSINYINSGINCWLAEMGSSIACGYNSMTLLGEMPTPIERAPPL